MSPEDHERLRSYVDQVVHFRMVDGEKLMAKVLMMQDEYGDFIYEVVSSDRPERYSNKEKACFVAPYSDVASFELAGKVC
jgi:hypothetical protein